MWIKRSGKGEGGKEEVKAEKKSARETTKKTK